MVDIICTVCTTVFALIAIIITYNTANKQVKEAKKSRDQQEQQYKESLKLQKEQYENELEHNRNIEIIQEKPYFVFVEPSDFKEEDSSYNTLVITLKNKGRGSAFDIVPDLEAVNEGDFDVKTRIRRNTPVQDPIAMVGENFKTYWSIDKFNIIGVVIPISIKFKDASERLYKQTFRFTVDNTGYVMVTNFAQPELLNE